MLPLIPISSFFPTVDDYLRFLVGLKERIVASDDRRLIVTLEKEGSYFMCMASVTSTGMYVGDYIKAFEATQENIDVFNHGVAILIERLNIYMMTNDPDQVPSKPPAFGQLTHVV